MSLTKQANKERIDKINKRVDFESLLKIDETVKEIILNVKNQGDIALKEYSEKFDNFAIDLNLKKPFLVQNSKPEIDNKLKEALSLASKRIEAFHKEDLKQFDPETWTFTGEHQERLGAKQEAIEAVAVYIPGGNAPLVSTLMMTAIPAQVAGVKRIALFSPPPINDAILYLAQELGINEIYQIGGAQAVAAAAFGTQSIEKFDKIVGPGNIYVSEAKKLLNGFIGIDGIYGPSELAILADETASIKKLAIDLLSQLEHGSGLESTLLVSTQEKLVDQIKLELDQQIEAINYSDKEKETIQHSIANWSEFIYTDNFNEAIELINYYAPEHLELQLNTKNLETALAGIKNAGAIFIGQNSCESLGDYLAGPSHCLPTAGSARFSSGLQVSDFFKKTSIIDFSQSTNIQDLIENTAKIARAEGLEAHARAAEYRLDNDKN